MEAPTSFLKTIFIVLLVFNVTVVFASTTGGELLWDETYGEITDDRAYSGIELSDGNILMTGYTATTGLGRFDDLYLIKTTSEGVKIWDQTYGGGGLDYGRAVIEVSSGGYVITGITTSFGAESYDVYLLKTDTDGVVVWENTFGGGSWDRGYDVIETSDGGYLVTGQTGSFGAGGSDIYLVKTDSSGEMEWTKTFGGAESENGWSVIELSSGGYLVAGIADPFPGDVYLVKTDQNGELIWERTYGGAGYDWGYSVIETSSGSYLITGLTTGNENWDAFLINTDQNGDVLWQNTYGGIESVVGISVIELQGGGFLFAGNSDTYESPTGSDVYLGQTDANGNLIWSDTFGGAVDDYGYAVSELESGGYLVTGYTDSYGAGSYDFYLIKTTSVQTVPVTYDITGTAYYSTTPIGDVQIDLVNDAEAIIDTSTTDSQTGQYLFTGVLPGDYTVWWRAPSAEYRTAGSHPVSVTNVNTNQDLELKKTITQTSPADESNAESPVTLSWESQAAADEYRIEVHVVENWVLLDNYVTSNTEFTIPVALVTGETYSWTLSSLDSSNNYIGHSDEWQFTVIEPQPTQGSDWPMFRANLEHTGTTDANAPMLGIVDWDYTTGSVVQSSPSVVDGKVYVGSDDNKVYCFDADTGAKIWEYTTGYPVRSSPAVVDGKVYIGSYDTKVYCLDATTGALIWDYTTEGYVHSSPAVVDGKVYIGSDNNNKIYCFDATSGALIWEYTTGDWVYSSPAVVDGKVYVGSDDGKVYCFDADTGAKIWEYSTGYPVRSSPAVVDGKVYIGSNAYKIYCLDAETGAKIWEYTAGSVVISSPAVVGNSVYIGSYDGKVYCLDAPTGAINWEYTTGSGTVSSPAVVGGKVYIGSNDKKVYSLDAETGAKNWEYTTGATIESSPAVADGKVYIGSFDKKIYSFSSILAPVPEEPDDSPVQAFALTIGAVASSDLTSGDQDWYKFTTQGTIYSIETISSIDTYLTLYDTDGTTVLAEVDDRPNDLDGLIIWEITTPGTYYIKVEGYDDTEVGSYDILVDIQTGTYTISGEVYYSTTLLPGMELDLYTEISNEYVTTTTSDGNGYYEFTQVPPGQYEIELTGSSQEYDYGAAEIDEYIAVMGQNVLVDFYLQKSINVINPDDGSSITDTNPTLQWISLPEAVYYEVELYENNGDDLVEDEILTSLQYEVQNTLSVGSTYEWYLEAFDNLDNHIGTIDVMYFTVTEAPVPEEPNDSPAQAFALTIGAISSSDLSAGDHDWYKFTTQGTIYSIETISSLDTYLTLYDTDGTTVLAEVDDRPDDLDSLIIWEITTPGTYYIEVEGYDDTEVGPYDILVDIQTGTYTISGIIYYSTILQPEMEIDLYTAITNEYVATTTTDWNGHYAFTQIPPALYEIKIAASSPDYIDKIENVAVMDQNVHVDIYIQKNVNVIYPEDGSTITETDPTLQWSSLPESSYYEIELYSNNGDNLVEYETVTALQYAVQTTLTGGSTYEWYLEAYDIHDNHIGTIDMMEFTVTSPEPNPWTMTVESAIALVDSTITFGLDESATTGFDQGLDSAIPPSPPTGIETYFDYPSNPQFLQELSTSIMPQEYPTTWDYFIHSIDKTGTLTITWDPTALDTLPENVYAYLLDDLGNTLANLRLESSFETTITTGETLELQILLTTTKTHNFDLIAGWNLISFPVIPTDTTPDAIFGEALIGIYTWDGSNYVVPINVEPFVGYWILVLGDVTIPVTGAPVGTDDITLSPGWTLMGPGYTSTLSGDVFLGYNQIVTWDGQEYVSSAILDSGVGYWALVLTETTVTLPANVEELWVTNPANGHQYRTLQGVTWEEAEDQAVALGGHLVTINDEAEQLWINSEFAYIDSTWLGLNDINQEGTWVWSSGQPVTYTNWDLNEPNDTGVGEDGAVLDFVRFPETLYWNDIFIGNTQWAIVEKGS